MNTEPPHREDRHVVAHAHSAAHDHDDEPHVHSHDLGPVALGRWATRAVVGILGAVAVAVVVGAVVLWPSHLRVSLPDVPGSSPTAKGTVEHTVLGKCDFTARSNGTLASSEPSLTPDTAGGCLNSTVKITSGPDAGAWTQFSIGTLRVASSTTPGVATTSGVDETKPATPGAGQPDLGPGTRIVMGYTPAQNGVAPAYSFYDYARGVSLWVWGLLFAAVVVAVALWRGLRALIGLAIAGIVVVGFALPSILQGNSAVWVALVSSAAILFAVLYLAHGLSLRTSSALLGTLSALALCALLSWLAVTTTKVTGLSSDDTANLQAYASSVSISGILLAGFVIGALGVLNDVTITQASAVFELARLSPKASRRRTFFSAMRVGRDHIASTVYTLVFAYVGSALPLLLLFSVAGRPLGEVLTSDAVAIELVRSFVGGIGLALSVPLTTAIAVLLAKPRHSAVSEAAVDRYAHSHPGQDVSSVPLRKRPSAPQPQAPASRAAQPPAPTPRTAPRPRSPQPAPEPPRGGRHSMPD
ncbi:YibE/F family protein [Tsukamurella sp. 8F]|uniref:YibE/F family protein n=1 Tax=unclassified Tsukamurella TaxID=2633480 RepID=UPI0023B90CA1|nr:MULTISPECIES: YibE/F family protein [unclassified Tsukamurella]MDF0528513.1 YibE/F family protein [Tsukamurella sp. 8J]MDF0586339.1 YibE/F family protein [Tsukamurella sp. 8F]